MMECEALTNLMKISEEKMQKGSAFSREPQSGEVKKNSDVLPSVKKKDRNGSKNLNQFN